MLRRQHPRLIEKCALYSILYMYNFFFFNLEGAAYIPEIIVVLYCYTVLDKVQWSFKVTAVNVLPVVDQQ